MSAPRRLSVEWDRLERVEDRLWFLAEVLKHTVGGLKPHHCEGLAAVLGDLATDVHELLDESNDLAAPGGHFH
jgi:hypothetical protein